MNCVQSTASYSHLLGSCVTMLLSACAYIITHTVSPSSEARREKGVSGRQTHEEEREERTVVEKTRERSVASEPQPNRTGCPAAVEREVKVQHEEEEKAAPAESTISNGAAAVLRNGDVTMSSVSDSKPVTKAKVHFKSVNQLHTLHNDSKTMVEHLSIA